MGREQGISDPSGSDLLDIVRDRAWPLRQRCTQLQISHGPGAPAPLISTGINDAAPFPSLQVPKDQQAARPVAPAQEALRRSILEASADCILLLDPQGRLLFMNEAGRRDLGIADLSILYGKPWPDMWPVAGRADASKAVSQAASGYVARFTSRCPSAQGAVRWWDVVVSPSPGADGKAESLICIARDVTHQKFAADQVRWAADHDPLTMLPNRSLFQQYLDHKIHRADAAGSSFALLLLDLDEFKLVNDTLGHDTGDALLCVFASRIRDGTRSDDFVARLGGDEFAIILGGIATSQQLNSATDAIFKKLTAPAVHEGRLLACRASIGAGIYPETGRNKSELMKNADIALYAAKEAGRGVSRLFEPSMRAEMQRRNSMLSLAKDAIARDWIQPFYQPKIDFRTGALTGFEALLRWEHPSEGIQTPDSIEAAFRDPVLAAAISDRIIDRVLKDMRQWLDQGIEFGHVAVNAAAAEFRRGDFAERVLERLHTASIPTHCFQLEVTESVFLGRGAEYVERALKGLSAAGVKIALDDFGTGYASLSHLKQFPVDIIKIDRSFVRDLHDDAGDEAIVRAVIGLGKSLNIKVVAEGIETPAQSAYLRKYDCDYGQGFLFSAAKPPSEIPALVKILRAKSERLAVTSRVADSLRPSVRPSARREIIG